MKKDNTFFTYIVTCADGTFYIGKTTNLEERLEKHNGIKKGGAKYTRGRRPVTLTYFEEYDSHTESAKREIELKKLTRKQKEEVIAQKLI